jgi:hypothetical protein
MKHCYEPKTCGIQKKGNKHPKKGTLMEKKGYIPSMQPDPGTTWVLTISAQSAVR